ncbi:helix-turn-helix domain-containing protein [Sphaerisporangium sp. TRM90804]|uniref:ArsR/SmtB family transcription factor n=1 Tax=Sphaerisporangium sp. TRM90804 TaxID=3031113 RepID=UPI00244BB435|nr:helix-turn-helix domain-containing protein [Sphaerisporangium sp. TRM90804]MDH2428139.1 helix-turn-helix domain-containing protein [Sphaerisporangium sp. TRM90804]
MTSGDKGTLRIVFTAQDLARTRVAARADLTWEMVGSLHRLQIRDGGAVMTRWRRRARADLAAAGLLNDVRSTLIPLAPRGPYFPDFLTPIEAQAGHEQALQALSHTPRVRVRHEMELLRARAGLPTSSLEDLARGDERSIRRLERVAAGYCQTVLSPHWPEVDRVLAQERGLLLRHLATGGIERMLSHLEPVMRWRPPVLEVDYVAGRHELSLRGRGLTLIPSYFCRMTPVALVDQRLPPVLVYPAAHHVSPAVAAGDPLAALVGRTRAEILHRIAATSGCTTSELARLAEVPLATASEHTRVLRQAGLVASTRQANQMLHQVTELGEGLIGRRSSVPGEDV